MKPVRITEATILRLIRLKAPVSQMVIIDKGIAQWLLDRVDEDHQRTRRETSIERYLRDMNAGNWVPWSAAFVFDGKGRLIQGQHLGAAFIRSNLKTLQTKIEVNPDPKAILGYDQGRGWSGKDVMKWGGHARAGTPVWTVLWQYERGFYKGTAYTAARAGDQYPTNSELNEMAVMHPDIQKYLRKPPITFKNLGIPFAALLAAVYVLHQLDYKKAVVFTESFFEGTNILPGSPIQVLRRSIEGRIDKKRLRNGEAVAWVFKAWNAWMNHQVLTKPIMRPKEPFPEPIPAPMQPPQSPARVQ